MTAMSLTDAVEITGMGRKKIDNLMTSGAWDIGEIVIKPGGKNKVYIIWSHKLAKYLGVTDRQIEQRLKEIDARRRNQRSRQAKL